MASDIHVLPIGDLVDHDERRDCWCHPEILDLCPLCDEPDPDCWRCNGRGLIESPVGSDARIVAHRAADGRE